MRTIMGKWRDYVLFGSKRGGWLPLHAAIAYPKGTVVTFGINGMEAQFNELVVEVEKKS